MSIHTLQLSDGRRVNLAHVTHTGGQFIYLAAPVTEWYDGERQRTDYYIEVSLADLALVNAALDTFAVKIPKDDHADDLPIFTP